MEISDNALAQVLVNSRYQAQFLQALRKMVVVIYEEPFVLEERVRQLLISPIDQWFLANVQDATNKQKLKDWCEQLIERVCALPVCVCEVPRPMRAQFYYQFVGAVRETAERPDLLVDLKVVPELLGGVRFTFQGLTYDFSVFGDFMRFQPKV